MEEWHWYLSSMKNRELYLLLTSPDKTSVSEMKTAIKKIMTDFYRRKQEKEILFQFLVNFENVNQIWRTFWVLVYIFKCPDN